MEQDSMARKNQVLFSLNRLTRRATCRSEDRVKNSLFFHVLHSILIEMSTKSEDEIEKSLKEGRLGFAQYSYPYKVVVDIKFTKVDCD